MKCFEITKKKPHLIGEVYDKNGNMLVPERLGIFVLKCKVYLSDLDGDVQKLKDHISHLAEYALTFKYDSADLVQNYINFKLSGKGLHSRVEVTNLDVQTFEIGKQVGNSNLFSKQNQRRISNHEKE